MEASILSAMTLRRRDIDSVVPRSGDCGSRVLATAAGVAGTAAAAGALAAAAATGAAAQGHVVDEQRVVLRRQAGQRLVQLRRGVAVPRVGKDIAFYLATVFGHPAGIGR